MKTTPSKDQKIVIIGPTTSIGQCVIEQLAYYNIPVTLIRPLDIHQESGKILHYNNHRLQTQPLDLFDFNARHIIFVCDKKIIPLLCRRKITNTNWWIDCTHSVHEAKCIIPSINGYILQHKHPHWICNPCSSVIALTQILFPIIKSVSVKSINLIMMMGTFFESQEASVKLTTQIRHILTKTPIPDTYRYPQLAFNIIPDYFHDLAQIIQRQLGCFISPPVTVHTCFTPVVRGTCIYTQLLLDHKSSCKQILNKLNHLTGICVIDSSTGIGLSDIITEDNVFVIHPSVTNNTLSFWCLQDAVQQGIGTNAAQLALLLLK